MVTLRAIAAPIEVATIAWARTRTSDA